jgi:hypothetical protein
MLMRNDPNKLAAYTEAKAEAESALTAGRINQAEYVTYINALLQALKGNDDPRSDLDPIIDKIQGGE